ncbi:hypothetical protein FKW77_003275 [Venturia effusa]|uniref:INO80 complex subunit B-like conserved region domain-containing protein n=1 Tax=Venturia effusa TaxID=50376 RepID=A0A517LDJ7_9PEZI|nr:hypothetical protein FKW77_003275 [Venturia effusa]
MDKYRSERPSKRLRRLSTEDDSEDGNSSVAPNTGSRRRRTAASGTTIERSSPAEDRTTSIRLTVKSDPKKLQQATRGRAPTARSGRSSILPDLAEIVSGPRQARKKAIVEETSEEEDEDDQTPAGFGDDDDDDDDDLSEEDAEGDEDEDEDMDAEGEDDEEMVDAPPPVRASAPKGPAAKPQVTITPAQELPSVEAKEMAMDDDDDDDEELSEPDEDAEGELDEEGGGDEDAEGEEDDDSEEDVSVSISRGDTPDLSKLTSRQRRQFTDMDDGSLLALSNGVFSASLFRRSQLTIHAEAQKKKVFTEEENAMRRTEMARRRKNLSEKRNEEEKQDTINKLLMRQASKRRSKAEKEADQRREEEANPDFAPPKANPVFARTIISSAGTSISYPSEWEGASFGPPNLQNSIRKGPRPYTGKLIEEIPDDEDSPPLPPRSADENLGPTSGRLVGEVH